jgi:SNF2 family DNA or RNA helicase
LPFLLRRTKLAVAQELPQKTVIDIMCPLSAEQRQLYSAYQSERHLSDVLMEQELLLLRATGSSKAGGGAAREGTAGEGCEGCEGEEIPPLVDNTADLAGEMFGSFAPLVPLGGQDDFAVTAASRANKNPLAALTYLKLLCVHPALVVDATRHRGYRARLLQADNSSGKLWRMASLLVESNVVGREELTGAGAADVVARNLLETPSSLFAPSSDPVSLEDSDSDVKEEGGDSLFPEEPAEPKYSVQDGELGQDQADNSSAPKKRKVSKGAAPSTVAASSGAVADHIKSALDFHTSTAAAGVRNRCLIFAQHRAALDLVEEQVLRRYFPSVPYARMDGNTAPQRRAQIARKFNAQRHAATAAGALSSSSVSFTAAAAPEVNDHVHDPRSRGEESSLLRTQIDMLKQALPASEASSLAPKSEGNRSSINNEDSDHREYAEIEGGSETRDAHDKDDIRILLMTTRSCGLGLNLSAANTVIFLEHDWNPFADLQAMDRVHRLGQTQPVTVYRLLGKSAVYCGFFSFSFSIV